MPATGESALVRATIGACALGVTMGWLVSNVGAVADPIADAYGVSLAMVGLFTTALFVVHASLQVPAGKAIDALGARRVGLVALAVIVVANAVALASPEPALAVVSRALAGVGTALGFLSGIDYVRSQGGSPFAQGLYGGIAIGGGGVALAVVPLVEGWIGWRAPFASAVIIAAGAAGLLLLGPPDSAGARPKRAGGGGVLDVFRDGRLLRICLVYTTSFGLTVVLGNWVVSLLTRAGDYREETAGAIGSLLLLGGVLSRPLGGALARRYPGHVRLAVAVCFAASVVGTGMLAVAGPVALSVLGSLVVGIAAGIPFAASFAAATRIRPEAPAEASAVVNMSANVLIVVATPLFGLAFSLPGEGRIGFAVAAGLWAAAALVTPAVRELESGGPGPDRRT